MSASWLRDAVFYEIYPQSFRDSNGDGIGDLPGITEKLPYVKSLVECVHEGDGIGSFRNFGGL